MTTPVSAPVTIVKSANDKLDYKYLELKNGLRAVLISDPSYSCVVASTIGMESTIKTDSGGNETLKIPDSPEKKPKVTAVKKGRNRRPREPMPKVVCPRLGVNQKLSAMALCVRSGSFQDPKEIQGLAHLVEHIITMGSEKFPKENDLDEYLTSRGGFQNAHTEYEYTLFEIEVQRKSLYGALERMANFFIKPQLRAETIDRETKPVDTEFNEAMNDDDVRVEQILNNIANKSHPLNTFAWGNTKSLKTIPNKNGTSAQKWVTEFVANNYKSDNIHIVVQSQESMETLENWITELFSAIEPSKQRTRLSDTLEKPFENNPEFTKLYYIEPIHEKDYLSIYWSLPPINTTKHYDCPPTDYIGHIIGHEGKGSLISHFRREQLALELSCGIDESGFANNRYSVLFGIQLKLTDLGKRKLDVIVDYVFQYLKIIQTFGPQEWFFEEFKNIEKNRFDWREEQSSIDNVKRIAFNMNNIPIENCLRGSKLYTKFDKELIQSYLKLLMPTNACFIFLSTNCLKKGDKTIRTEKWFGTQYKVFDVPKQWLQTRAPDIVRLCPFAFPEKNPFIATDFTIKSKELKIDSKLDVKPNKVLDKTRLKLWYKLDEKFRLPKAVIKLHLVSPVTYDTIENSVLTDFFFEYLVLVLTEEVYAASLAGLHWSITQSNTGLIVNVGGYNHKITVLLETVINRMINLEFKESKLPDVKKCLSKSYNNIFVEPNNLNRGLRLSLIGSRHVNPVEKRSVVDNIDMTTLKAFVVKLFSNFFVEALIEGNITEEESLDIMNKIEAKLKLNSMSGPFEEPKLQAMEIPIGETCCRVLSMSANNKNSAITNYYQLKPGNIRLHCMTSVLSSFMEEPSFNTLRTKEGLGYHVSASDYDTYGISAYGVSVSSSGDDFDCTFIDQRIENFLKIMIDLITNMKEETFKQQVKSIVVAKKAPDLSLTEEFMRFWNEIISFNYCFDRLDKEIKILSKLTFKEFKDYALNEALKNPKRRKLSIQIVGNGKKSLAECLTIDGKEVRSKSDTDKEVEKSAGGKNPKKFKILHLKSKNETKYTYIDDIPKFKKNLNMYPITKVID